MTTMILLLFVAVLLLVGSPISAFVPPTPPPSSAAAATATVGGALGSSLRRSSPPCLGSDHEISLGTFRSGNSLSAEAVPLSSRGGGRRRNASIVRRNMFPSPRAVDEEGGGAGAAVGGDCNWRVPRKIAARLGAGEGEGDEGEEKFLPFEFELERAPPSAGRRRGSSTAARGGGSFYFPSAAAGVVAAASPSSSDAAVDPKTKEAGASSSVTTKTSSSSSSSLTQSPPRVVVRHLRESDLNEAVDMCVKEFGSYSDPNDDPFRRDSAVNGNSVSDDRLPGYVVSNRDDGGLTLGKILEPLWTAYENWAFSWVVRIGLYMRIVRSNEGFQGGSPHDHNVLCLVEKGEGKEDEDVIVAIAELSLQPADPLRNAPPYVLPLSAKRAIGQKAGVGEPRAYVSNVLVRPDRRGRGYGRAIVAACEGLAQSWGCGDASLHVDADVDSGRAAQGLYRAMGYRGVMDEGAGTSKGKERPELKWMGPEMIQKGVYVVEGVPLLYMRKKLNDR